MDLLIYGMCATSSPSFCFSQLLPNIACWHLADLSTNGLGSDGPLEELKEWLETRDFPYEARLFVTTSKALVTRSDALVTSSFLLLVVRPGAPSSVLAPSSDARSPIVAFLLLDIYDNIQQSTCPVY